MQRDLPPPRVPACVALIRAFLDQHLHALCGALHAVGAAEIAQLLQSCASGVSSHEPLCASGGGEQHPQAAFIRQRCWLELHHGVYRNVAVVWRDVYLATSLLLAAQAASASPAAAPMLQRALKAIDSALLFGAILGRSIAEDVYEELALLLQRCTPHPHSAKKQKVDQSDSDVDSPPSTCVFDVRLTEQQLPRLTRPMPTLPPPSLLQFRSRYLQPLLPVVLQSLADHWPATTRWRDLSYLEAAAGTRTVPVELGDHYLAHNWQQKLMPVSQFIKDHIVPATNASSTACVDPPGGKVKGYVAQHDLFSQVKKLRGDIVVPDYVCATAHSDAVAGACPAAAAAYLAHVREDSPYYNYHCCSCLRESSAPPAARGGHAATLPLSPSPPPPDLKTKVLRECVSPPPPEADAAADGTECSVRMHAWFGPAGAAARGLDLSSNAHVPLQVPCRRCTTTPATTCLCKCRRVIRPAPPSPAPPPSLPLQGYKYVRLYAPCQSHRLYPFTSGLTTNSSQVDVADVDDAMFPLFRGAPYLEAVLEPGDALFIPIFHWHYVRSLTPSFSVSFWWK